ncbi:MAG: serine/threonine protein kinase [Muribaculaceae bacterium]|nr:serine/threonine protein kinase [Muribaculaceae bacterium]
MTRWPFRDNMHYEAVSDRVLLHTPDEDFFYISRHAPVATGGMGCLLRGWSLKDNRQVAIKRIHDKYANIPEIRNRARAEAKLVFRHQNLIEMLGMVESKTGKGPIFIISNYVVGSNIDSFIRTNLSTSNFKEIEREQKIVTMILPVVEALRYIHAYNIFHLDIKPSNIMVENGRNVRLMDLGIAMTHNISAELAKEQHDGGGTGTNLMGTPRYAAPEQFGLPNFGEVSNKSDIYELGITLYELLTEDNPFNGLSLADSMQKHKELVLPKHELVSPHLMEILRRASSPHQNNRYQNVEELIEDLNKFLTNRANENWRKKFLKKFGF